MHGNAKGDKKDGQEGERDVSGFTKLPLFFLLTKLTPELGANYKG